jgi:hypothetical protein
MKILDCHMGSSTKNPSILLYHSRGFSVYKYLALEDSWLVCYSALLNTLKLAQSHAALFTSGIFHCYVG